MKTIIVVWGAAQRGKSEGLKRLAKRFPFSTILRPWNNDDYDSYVIGSINDKDGRKRIVGIESLGDPGSCQEEWICACVSWKCEVIVAASRSYGSTYEAVYRIARENGYDVIEITPLFHRGGPVLSNGQDLRDTFAENVNHLILSCLE